MYEISPYPPGVVVDYAYADMSWRYAERDASGEWKVLKIKDYLSDKILSRILWARWDERATALVEAIHARSLDLGKILVGVGVDIKTFDPDWYKDVAEPTYEVL